jgi:hypothetical protein
LRIRQSYNVGPRLDLLRNPGRGEGRVCHLPSRRRLESTGRSASRRYGNLDMVHVGSVRSMRGRGGRIVQSPGDGQGQVRSKARLAFDTMRCNVSYGGRKARQSGVQGRTNRWRILCLRQSSSLYNTVRLEIGSLGVRETRVLSLSPLTESPPRGPRMSRSCIPPASGCARRSEGSNQTVACEKSRIGAVRQRWAA